MNSRKPFVRFRMMFAITVGNSTDFMICPEGSYNPLGFDWVARTGMRGWPVNGRESEVGR